MTKTLIGIDYANVACVKITRGNINPVTEPDGNRYSFLYNSKYASDVKLWGYDSTPYAPNVVQYWPAGADEFTYTKKKSGGGEIAGLSGVTIRNSYFPGLPYDIPLYDIKYRRLSTDRFIENHRNYSESAEDNQGREAGYRTMLTYYNNGWWNYNGTTAGGQQPPGRALIYSLNTYGARDAAELEASIVVWRLPATNVPLVDAVTPAIPSGQRVVEITASACRVAKPGYDTRTATPTQLAFDSSGKPLSVIRAGDVALVAGLNEIPLGYPVDNSFRCDILQYENNDPTYPVSGYHSDLTADYWFSGNSLWIISSAASRVRYLVFAANASSPTFGNNDVLRQFNDGSQDVVQFLRPGAGSNPQLADIVLDSRWPSIFMLAEGWLNVPNRTRFNPNVSYNIGDEQTVYFDGTGMFAFPKYMTVLNHPTLGQVCKAPSARLIENYNNITRYNASGSSFCRVGANSATFYTYEGNPYGERFQSGQGWLYDYPPETMVGIRYFILGIPAL